jgi:hypothetical protein
MINEDRASSLGLRAAVRRHPATLFVRRTLALTWERSPAMTTTADRVDLSMSRVR